MIFKSNELESHYNKLIKRNKRDDIFVVFAIIIIVILFFMFSFTSDEMMKETYIGMLFLPILFLIVILVGKNTGKKRLDKITNITQKEWDIICDEFDNKRLFSSKFISLTPTYIVDLSTFEIIKYNDIVWAYFITSYYIGIKVESVLAYWTNDGIFHSIPDFPNVNKKKKAELNKEIFNIINSKCKDLIVGYSVENEKMANTKFVKKSI